MFAIVFQVYGGGETGIRTLGTREGSTVFETVPFDHSGTSPRGETWRFSGAETKVQISPAQEGNYPK